MKHKLSITLILLSMFLVTQLIGLFVVQIYAPSTTTNPLTGKMSQTQIPLPFGLQQSQDNSTPTFTSLLLSFILAFAIIFILIKYKWKMVIRLWFFLVVILALAISLNAIFRYTSIANASIIALTIAIPLSFLKIFKPNLYIHNATELLIYPGIAAVFVPILTVYSVMILLLLISIYDAWAVWKSGIMQKMAKFQMDELKIFGGFLLPSLPKKTKAQIKNLKVKYKNKEMPASAKNKKFKINLAILGGGDVIFPIITAGVFMRAYNIIPAIFIIGGSLVGLLTIFIFSKKGKAYPAMPYITTGIFASLLVWKILF